MNELSYNCNNEKNNTSTTLLVMYTSLVPTHVKQIWVRLTSNRKHHTKVTVTFLSKVLTSYAKLER